MTSLSVIKPEKAWYKSLGRKPQGESSRNRAIEIRSLDLVLKQAQNENEALGRSVCDEERVTRHELQIERYRRVAYEGTLRGVIEHRSYHQLIRDIDIGLSWKIVNGGSCA